MEEKRLREIYENFVSFGSYRNLATGEDAITSSGAQMDNAKFAKFCRDTKVIDKKCTTTDVDIVFNKVKSKGARKIDFSQFEVALRELAVIKYRGKNSESAYEDLLAHVLRNDTPVAKGTVPQTGGIFDKLLYDQSTFPATHKNRFNEDGTGRGKEGRIDQEGNLTADLNSVVNRSSNGVLGGSRHGSSNNLSGDSGAHAGARKLESNKSEDESSGKKNYTATKSSKGNLSSSNKNSSPRGSGTIFDRLTDSSQYTGTHKHRFNADGTGRGIAGRDSVPLGTNPGTYRGGDVKDLSQILRN